LEFLRVNIKPEKEKNDFKGNQLFGKLAGQVDYKVATKYNTIIIN
jgi:hypothetical protein